ncbi:rhodanese-like domain-containing protein [Streptococcus sinensis]|uniref:rhodanese-like domain-containing protein n=1 Tax=Streptococcus sinensis TaxID=176090 RepID=UPI00272A76ED|nr:rhodanese-like domain-containing protein [Streptococcus sinensis]
MKTISAADLEQQYQSEKLAIVDVRERHEFQAGHIPTASNLPLSELETGYKKLEPQYKYYIICQAGARSAAACQFLAMQGFDVTNVSGGMNAWSGEIK